MWVLILLMLAAGRVTTFPVNVPLSTAFLQSSAALGNNPGPRVSQPNYTPAGWYRVTLPATVVAGLLQNEVYTDPLYGLNLQNISSDQFAPSWWFRIAVPQLPATGGAATLTFTGLNYRANVWMNGKLLASNASLIGSFRYFDVDISQSVAPNSNTIAVEVFRPSDRCFPPSNNDTDLAITFVDWAPNPPDNSMGLWRETFITVTGPATVRYPLVQTSFNSDTLDSAYLAVSAEVKNLQDRVLSGELRAQIAGLANLSMTLSLGPKETKLISFPRELVQNPPVWWPWQMGEPTLSNLTLTLLIQGEVSDETSTQFGIRSVEAALDSNQHLLFKVNKKPILIRGGGWAPDLFLRVTRQRQETEFKMIKHLGLNAVRLEGKMEDDHFFELADRNGLLVLPGWCCCDAWQHWPVWGNEQFLVANESLRSQVKRLRIHPSVITFLYASDEIPPLHVEQQFLQVFREELWPNPTLSSAADRTSTITGRSGVKMSGPYSWEPPNYWSEDTQNGGAFGFNTETSPGAAPLTMESWTRTVPKDHLWPIDDYWNYHCANPQGMFHDLRFFTPPLNARYGDATSAADYLLKAQVMSYESHRAMLEAYSAKKYTSTGIVQWMLNNAWPMHYWHLYDYYLNTGGSYFGAKKALETVHIQYNNDPAATIVIVNSLYQPVSDLTATVQIYSVNGEKAYENVTKIASVPSDGVVIVGTVPTVHPLTKTYFLALSLSSGTSVLSRNVYWLSTHPDVLDWSASNWYRTPCKSWADLQLLESLPAVHLNVTSTITEPGRVQVVVQNPSGSIAFFLRLRLVQGSEDVLPTFWDDNFISLMPGETRTIIGSFDPQISMPAVVAELWNNRNS
eukprot:TRINITY_DN17211_c0_g1_i4.p1 TRINITY_DN17211_c0_g1~~TRINITY_DN17211_c0_g1_i4.p1  ORF type:complete len:861 (-),score=104.81 TRINITY_DN17211_c0_g1_i4:6-2558(-)